MTATVTLAPARTRRFWWHFTEMLVAMAVGMMVLAPLWHPLGIDRADLHALVMATDMSVGMAAWMRYRRHGWRSTAEMCAAMYAAFLVLFPPLWAGLIGEEALFAAGHGLMLPAMLAVMLARPHGH